VVIALHHGRVSVVWWSRTVVPTWWLRAVAVLMLVEGAGAWGRGSPCASWQLVAHRRGGAVAIAAAMALRGGRASSRFRHRVPSDGTRVRVPLVHRGGRVRAVVVASWLRRCHHCGGVGVGW
jgi:hypothetical protein